MPGFRLTRGNILGKQLFLDAPYRCGASCRRFGLTRAWACRSWVKPPAIRTAWGTMRKFSFIVFLFLNASVSSALATEYGALAVQHWRDSRQGWPFAVSTGQSDPETARDQAMAQCQRETKGALCAFIVFESDECVAFTIGNRGGLNRYLSVKSTIKSAIDANRGLCLAEGNESCTTVFERCEPASSPRSSNSFDKAFSGIADFVRRFDLSSTLAYLPYAGTVALFLFIVLHLRTFLQKRRHIPQDLIRNAGLSILIGVAGTYWFLLAWFSVPQLFAFYASLSLATKLLLSAIGLGLIIFMLPISFWDALKQTFASSRKWQTAQFNPPDVTMGNQNPPAPSSVGASATPGASTSPAAPPVQADPTQIPIITPPPRPARIDTEGAIEDMRLARSYMDEWYEKKGAPASHISFAAKYIEQARAKDPDAKLAVPSEKEKDKSDI